MYQTTIPFPDSNPELPPTISTLIFHYNTVLDNVTNIYVFNTPKYSLWRHVKLGEAAFILYIFYLGQLFKKRLNDTSKTYLIHDTSNFTLIKWHVREMFDTIKGNQMEKSSNFNTQLHTMTIGWRYQAKQTNQRTPNEKRRRRMTIKPKYQTLAHIVNLNTNKVKKNRTA